MAPLGCPPAPCCIRPLLVGAGGTAWLWTWTQPRRRMCLHFLLFASCSCLLGGCPIPSSTCADVSGSAHNTSKPQLNCPLLPLQSRACVGLLRYRGRYTIQWLEPVPSDDAAGVDKEGGAPVVGYTVVAGDGTSRLRRLDVCFSSEDPSNFARRVAVAHRCACCWRRVIFMCASSALHVRWCVAVRRASCVVCRVFRFCVLYGLRVVRELFSGPTMFAQAAPGFLCGFSMPV